MRRVLKIRNVSIWNFPDLKRAFDPLELYAQLDVFRDFARVNCLPLPTWLTDRETVRRYPADRLTKDFWHALLCRADWQAGIGAKRLFLELLSEAARSEAGPEDAGEIERVETACAREAADARIEAKLARICAPEGDGQDARRALTLLAICELCEVDPMALASSAWHGACLRRRRPCRSGSGRLRRLRDGPPVPGEAGRRSCRARTPGRSPLRDWRC